MNKEELKKILGFIPSREQEDVIAKIISFFSSEEEDTFILTGAAGTGKTSILKAILQSLPEDMKPVLMAPTGRAASILSSKTGRQASTIHAQIYLVHEEKDKEGNVLYIRFVKREKVDETPTVFFVDEASMLGDVLRQDPDPQFVADAPLLPELIRHIKKGNKKNKLVFIGDPYQLPPVHMEFSPALSPEHLEEKYALRPLFYELTEVKRQSEGSYILTNAVNLRNAITHGMMTDDLVYEPVAGEDEAIEKYCQQIKEEQTEDLIYLAWKNVTVSELNSRIRGRLFGTWKTLVAGERVILDQGNYHGTYIPGGTLLTVEEVLDDSEEIAGIRFATVKLRYSGTDTVIGQEFKVFLEYLLSDPVSRRRDQKMSMLWHERYKVNKELRDTRNKLSDPYLAALRLKYAYAVTTHKAQGGEWKTVYLHPEFPFGPSSVKWLYTSVTRAKEHLYSFPMDLLSGFGSPGTPFLRDVG